MTSTTDAGDLAAPLGTRSPLSVVCVDDDPGFLGLVEQQLAAYDDISLRTETDPATALDHVGSVDCVVSDYDMPGMDGHDVLTEVRDRDDALPFVLVTSYADDDVVDPVLSEPSTDYLRKSTVSTTRDLLVRRVRTLVDHRRSKAVARRVLSAVETAQAGVAIAGPDGRFAFVDRAFERRFGHQDGDLTGVPWRSIYTDEEVDRMEEKAVSAAEDGWRWSGRCEGIHADGSTVTVPTTVSGPGDGSLVFVITDDE